MDALVLGCNGAVGRAIAAELATAGWSVTGTGRDPDRFPRDLADAGVTFHRSDRYDARALRAATGSGHDLVVDCLCYTAAHARQLLAHEHDLGHLVVISSKAVYVDGHGRHSNSDQAPDFGGSVNEQHSVLSPDWSGHFRSRDGYGANKVAAEEVLLTAQIPVTVLRASRVHGRGSARPREWFVVRRLLDGRTRIPLARRGRTANHPSAATNIARLVRACADVPTSRVLNAADPDAPTANDMVGAVAAACGLPVGIGLLPDSAPADLGRNPWDSWPPYLLDTSAALAVPGYDPCTYAEAVQDEVDWLVDLRPDERATLDADAYVTGLFDYARDDCALELCT